MGTSFLHVFQRVFVATVPQFKAMWEDRSFFLQDHLHTPPNPKPALTSVVITKWQLVTFTRFKNIQINNVLLWLSNKNLMYFLSKHSLSSSFCNEVGEGAIALHTSRPFRLPPAQLPPCPTPPHFQQKCHSCAICVSGQNFEHLLSNDYKSRNFHAPLAWEDSVINDCYSRKFRISV